MKIPADTLSLLSMLEYPAASQARIVEQIDRPAYTRINKVLEALGGTWNRKARAHVFEGDARIRIDAAITAGEVTTHSDLGYFPTPPSLARQLIAMADVMPGHTVLEPSAGEGAIVQELIDAGALVVAVERDPARRDKLRALRAPRGVQVLDLDDCMDIDGALRFDRIVMNPPFCKVGAGDHLDHVRKAAGLLQPKGVLVSVLPSSVTFRRDKRYAEFRSWTEAQDGKLYELPEQSFKSSGTSVHTVALRLVRKAPH
jgi:predicted RNA methylase